VTRGLGLVALSALFIRLRAARYLFALGAAIIDAGWLPAAMRVTIGRCVYRLGCSVVNQISTAFRR
jgi:hypothetical protein